MVLKKKITRAGGQLPGNIKPIWRKAVVNKQRIEWLGEMLDKKLVVRSQKYLSVQLRKTQNKECKGERHGEGSYNGIDEN